MDSTAEQITISAIDLDDRAAIEQHIAFEREHGTPRFEQVDQLLAWLPTTERAALFAARDASGTLVGCAAASTLGVLPSESVQLNAFAVEHDPIILDTLSRAVVTWEPRASELLAHVTAPTPEEEAMWSHGGFELVGRRTRLERTVGDADRNIESRCPEGVEVTSLTRRPELRAAMLDAWNEAFADIPSPIPFAPLSGQELRRHIGIGEDEEFPDSLFVAVTTENEVAGVACVLRIPESCAAGHRFTGVPRAWRGRGVARALKVEAIRWAALNDIALLRASNDDGNDAMRAINDSLGYESVYRLAMFRRDVERELNS